MHLLKDKVAVVIGLVKSAGIGLYARLQTFYC